MAYSYGRRYGRTNGRRSYRRRTYRGRRSKYTRTERMAYEVGRVFEGKKNPSSKVAISYAKGINSVQSYKARVASPNPRSMF